MVEDKKEIMLAMEKCEGSIENMVQLMKICKVSNPQKVWPFENPLRGLFISQPKILADSLLIRRLMWQMLNGLKFLHEHGIAHQNIKPSTILINRLKITGIADFK